MLRDTQFINLSTSGELGLLAGRGSAGQCCAVGHGMAWQFWWLGQGSCGVLGRHLRPLCSFAAKQGGASPACHEQQAWHLIFL